MKLSIKMVVLFSVIILAALLMLSSYAVQTSVAGANTYSQSRLANMSESIDRYLEEDFGMMRLTLEELTENTSFMAAVNQFVRDDSPDQKMAGAALTAALQQLYQSPLVDRFYRVTFFTPDGSFITSQENEDGWSSLTSQEPFSVMGSLGMTEAGETADGYRFLPPHPDVFDSFLNTWVYGIGHPVEYRGKDLGTLVILGESASLDRLMDFVDNPAEVTVSAVFDTGAVLYTSDGVDHAFPADLPLGEAELWSEPDTSRQYNVLHTKLESLGLHLYVAQDNTFMVEGNRTIRLNILKRALLIMLPAVALIILASYLLTRSIRRLTKKVSLAPVEGVLNQDSVSVHRTLSETVTFPGDKEIRELEVTYNKMMLRLWESTLNELALREGTLQAQLKALQTQINPHFIYNTLNIISAKSMESGNYDVIEICDQFASMLRYSTDTRSRTATMEEEIENVRNYLLLAKARFEENLEFVIDVPQDLQGIQVPKLTLQPLVENALNHGYDGANVLRKLSVIGTIRDDTLVLEIHDNGTGFSEEMLENLRRRIADIDAGNISIEDSSGHIGLVNTCLRLHYYSGGAMRISIHNENGAVITLTMPVGA